MALVTRESDVIGADDSMISADGMHVAAHSEDGVKGGAEGLNKSKSADEDNYELWTRVIAHGDLVEFVFPSNRTSYTARVVDVPCFDDTGLDLCPYGMTYGTRSVRCKLAPAVVKKKPIQRAHGTHAIQLLPEPDRTATCAYAVVLRRVVIACEHENGCGGGGNCDGSSRRVMFRDGQLWLDKGRPLRRSEEGVTWRYADPARVHECSSRSSAAHMPDHFFILDSDVWDEKLACFCSGGKGAGDKE